MTTIDDACGRELDALVAERVMGFRLHPTERATDGSPLILREIPRFSESAAMARGIGFTLEQRHPGTASRYESQSPTRYVIRGPSGREYEGVDDSEATAICRAMVKAMDGEGPGIPGEQAKSDRSPRAIAAAADLLSAKAAPHQSVGILMQGLALQQGDRKEAPARALLEWATPANAIVPIVAAQLSNADENVALLCHEILQHLARAGEAARRALNNATGESPER